MSGPSQLISMRIPDEYLVQLNQKVGFDGMRTRSDVIRTAVQEYLHRTPDSPDVQVIPLEIGTELQLQLKFLYELRGERPQEAARNALDDYLKRRITDGQMLSDLLQARVDELRSQTRPHQDHTP